MMNNNRGRDIFFGVVALATLIVAIVGATLAYFSVTASSNEGAVGATAAKVSIEYLEGKQVTIKGDALIPADFETVVKKIYEKKVKDQTAVDVETLAETTNLCVDDSDKHYQVCSVYRFTVSSTESRSITAKLNTEHNGFTYLKYAVYDVTNEKWVELTTTQQSAGLKTCSNKNNTGDDAIITDDCYDVVTETGVKQNYIENSIFGLAGDGTFSSTKLTSGIEQTYDVILFIQNDDQINQNIDQGQTYSGHVVIDVLDGGLTGDKIQGVAD